MAKGHESCDQCETHLAGSRTGGKGANKLQPVARGERAVSAHSSNATRSAVGPVSSKRRVVRSKYAARIASIGLVSGLTVVGIGAPSHAESLRFQAATSGVVTLEHWQSFLPVNKLWWTPSTARQRYAMGRTFTTAWSVRKRGTTFPLSAGSRIYGSWGSGTYKVTAKAKYATKYRTVPYYGNVTRDVTVGYSYNCWTSQYPDINRTKSRPTMTCRRSDGLERSWYDPWYDSLYYDPEFRPVADDFNSNIVNMSYLYYFRDYAASGTVREERTTWEQRGTYDEFYGWKVKTLNRTVKVRVR